MAIFKKNILVEFTAYHFQYDGQTERMIENELTCELPGFKLLDLEFTETISMNVDGEFIEGSVLYLKQRAYDSYGRNASCRLRVLDGDWVVEDREGVRGYSVMTDDEFKKFCD